MIELPHAYVIELVQLFASFLGVCCAAWALWDAVQDKVAIDRAGVNGARATLVRSNVRTELAKIVVFTLFIIVGVVGVILPPPFTTEQIELLRQAVNLVREREGLVAALHAEREMHTAVSITRGVMIAATLVMLADSAMERRDRRVYAMLIRKGKLQRRSTDAEQSTTKAEIAAVQAQESADLSQHAANAVQETATMAQTVVDEEQQKHKP